MRIRQKILTAIGISLIAIATNSMTTEAKDLSLFSVTCDASSFIYAGPTTQSDRLGDTTKGVEYKVYKEVTNPENTVYFYCIKKGNEYVYVPTFTFTESDVYKNGVVSANTLDTVSFVKLEGNIKKGAYEELIKYYLLLPLEIREMFQIEGHNIKMTEAYIGDEAYPAWTGGYLNGVSDYKKKMVYINDENARYIVHEMGHYVNNRLGNFANRQENNALYLSEANKVSYYSTNNREYFCECFDQYFRCPELLKQESPASYAMVNKAVKEFKEMATPILDEYWGRN